VTCKAKSAAIAGATASIFNAAGRKKKKTEITSCARGEYIDAARSQNIADSANPEYDYEASKALCVDTNKQRTIIFV